MSVPVTRSAVRRAERLLVACPGDVIAPVGHAPPEDVHAAAERAVAAQKAWAAAPLEERADPIAAGTEAQIARSLLASPALQRGERT